MELECETEEFLSEKAKESLSIIERESSSDKDTITLTRQQLLNILTEGHQAYFKKTIQELNAQVATLFASRNEWMETATELRTKVEKLQHDINLKSVCSACGHTESRVANHQNSAAPAAKPTASVSKTVVAASEERAGVIDLTDEDMSSKTTEASKNSSLVTFKAAPLPAAPKLQWAPVTAKEIPPKPILKCTLTENGINLHWSGTITDRHEEVAFYQLFSYQQNRTTGVAGLWKRIGNVKALPLPMACTLSQFQPGSTYFFAVRAMDIHHRVSEFSNASGVNL